MARLSPLTITRYAYDAGFQGADLVRAVATAMAESSGNTDVVSWTGCCWGLWQINVKAHPQYTIEQMKDPAQNARAAFAIKQSQGWGAWKSSLAGQALWTPIVTPVVAGFMASNPARTVGDVASGAVGNAASSVANATGIPQAVHSIELVGKWISTPANWLRVMYVIIGGTMVVGALIVLSKPVTEPIAKVATKVA